MMTSNFDLWKGPDKINWLCVFLKELVQSNDMTIAPLLLSGFRSVWHTPITQDYEQALINLRHFCLEYSSSTAIRKAVLRHKEHHYTLSQNNEGDRRIFDIHEKKLTFKLINEIPPAEYNKAKEILLSSLPLIDHSIPQTTLENRTHFLKISDEVGTYTYKLEGLPVVTAPSKHLERSPKPRPIKITFNELFEQARSMDIVDKKLGYRAGNWESRLQNILFNSLTAEGNLSPSEEITLDGLKHLIGLPGSGKTTLLICLTRYLALHDYKIVIFFPSLEVCRQYLVKLRTYGVETSLLMGRSGKSKLRQAHQIAESIASGDSQNGFAKSIEGAEFFATSCPLPSFTRASETGLFPTTTYCEFVYEKEGRKKPEKVLCPLWSICGYQKSSRQLTTAKVWLGHIASVDTEVPKHTTLSKQRYFDLVARNSDVVIFDEADRVQSYLDEQGIAQLSLTGDSRSFNADLLKRQSAIAAGQNYLLGDPRIFFFHISTLDFSRSSHLLVNAIQTLDREHKKRFEGSFLTPTRILSSLLTGFKKKKSKPQEDIDSLFRRKDAISQLWESAAINAYYNREGQSSEIVGRQLNTKFIAENLSLDETTVSESHGLLIQFFRQWFVKEYSEELDKVLEEISKLINPFLSIENRLERLQLVRLLTTVTFTILSYRRLAPYANELIEQGIIEPLNLEQRCSDDFLKYTTENILGGLSGVRFFLSKTDSNQSQAENVKLQYVVFAGSPRSYMYHLHEPYGSQMDTPAVLLTSATSFLEQSPAFHIEEGPHYLVKSKTNTLRFTGSKFYFYPLKKDPAKKSFLRYSGEPSAAVREENLKSMLHRLLEGGVKNSIVGKACREFDSDTKRRKAAIVVNSFEQCQYLKHYIDSRFPDWRTRTATLTREVEKNGENQGYITASQVESVGDDDNIELLIFPMGAIGRGVNIVFTEGLRKRDAAIGNLFFLTRPHPSIDDLSLLVSIAGQASEAFNRSDFREFTQLEDIQDNLKQSRKKVYAQIGRLLRNPLMASRLGKLLEPFTANIAVELLQTIGRGMRNGCPVQCFFIDAAWARNSTNGEVDTPVTSMLVQLIEILEHCIYHEDIKKAAVYKELYEPFLDPLKRTEGLIFDQNVNFEDPTEEETFNSSPLFDPSDPPPF